MHTLPELDAKIVSQDDYWRSLTWLNDILLHDDFACGACLFAVGCADDWATFRHFGQAGLKADILYQMLHLMASPYPV